MNFQLLSLPALITEGTITTHTHHHTHTHTHTRQVSATFAASLVISPALGTWIEDHNNGQAQVILLATMIAIFNLVFIVFMVPESLPERSRKASWGSPITWEMADPFSVGVLLKSVKY